MKSKKIIIIAIAVNLAILAVGLWYYLSIPVDVSIEIDSRDYCPGDVVIIKIKTSRELKESTLVFNSQKTKFFETGKNDDSRLYRGLIAVPLNCKPGENALEIIIKFPIVGTRRFNRTVNIKSRKFKRTHIASLSRTNKIMKTLAEESRVARQLRSKITPENLREGRFIIPVKGRFSSPYGQVRTYGKRRRKGRHRGTDISAPKGTKIKAANNGVVSMAAKFRGIGNTILVDHGQGIQSIYMHLDSIDVKRTDTVNKGGIIGTVGSTGQSTGPHLHWGVYVNNVAVDPMQFTEKDIP